MDMQEAVTHSGRYMSPETLQNLLTEIALGRLSLSQLADKYSRSYDRIRHLAVDHKRPSRRSGPSSGKSYPSSGLPIRSTV
jgi:hypothetical protein